MNSFVIDSSVYIARYNKNDVFHETTKIFFRKASLKLRHAKFFMPILVLFEVTNYFSRNKDSKIKTNYEIFEKEAIKDLQNSIDILDSEFLFAFRRFVTKINLKTADAIIACSAAIHNATLVSWDKKLLKAVKSSVSTATPAELNRKLLR